MPSDATAPGCAIVNQETGPLTYPRCKVPIRLIDAFLSEPLTDRAMIAHRGERAARDGVRGSRRFRRVRIPPVPEPWVRSRQSPTAMSPSSRNPWRAAASAAARSGMAPQGAGSGDRARGCRSHPRRRTVRGRRRVNSRAPRRRVERVCPVAFPAAVTPPEDRYRDRVASAIWQVDVQIDRKDNPVGVGGDRTLDPCSMGPNFTQDVPLLRQTCISATAVWGIASHPPHDCRRTSVTRSVIASSRLKMKWR